MSKRPMTAAAPAEPGDRVRLTAEFERTQLLGILFGGFDRNLVAIENRLGESRQTLSVTLDASDGAGLSWLYRHTEVLDKTTHDEGHVSVTVRATPDKAAQVRAKFAL